MTDHVAQVKVPLVITNKTDQKVAYKVSRHATRPASDASRFAQIKCTRNDVFRISNSVDLLNAGDKRTIHITYR